MVEDITKRREPLPQLVGIYFISPTEEHIKQLVRDFSLAAMPQYRHAHVFFSSKPSSQHLAAIRECPHLVSRLRTLKEVRGRVLLKRKKSCIVCARCWRAADPACTGTRGP